MKTYRHLFFDLDHTLWDYEQNASETLEYIFDKYALGESPNATKPNFIAIFRDVNFSLWDLYDNGVIDKEYIRQKRFPLIFEKMGIGVNYKPEDISDLYLAECPKKKNLIKGSIDVLNYLQDKYELHILTNGFQDVQNIKIKNSGLKEYFKTMTTSECSGYKKPNKKAFEYAMGRADALPTDSIMIGDNINTDIKGAIAAQMDCVYFNPERKKHEVNVNYDIADLEELTSFL